MCQSTLGGGSQARARGCGSGVVRCCWGVCSPVAYGYVPSLCIDRSRAYSADGWLVTTGIAGSTSGTGTFGTAFGAALDLPPLAFVAEVPCTCAPAAFNKHRSSSKPIWSLKSGSARTGAVVTHCFVSERMVWIAHGELTDRRPSCNQHNNLPCHRLWGLGVWQGLSVQSQ